MPTTHMPIVALTYAHSITCTVALRDQRLSDLLNDRRDSVIEVIEAVVTGHTSSRKIESSKTAVLSKDNLVLAFEQLEEPAATTKRPYAFTVKQRYDVFLISQGIEIRGSMYFKGNLDLVDLHRFIATSGERFMPVTNATVTLPGGHVFRKRAGVLVSTAHIHYIAKADPSSLGTDALRE